MTGILETVKQSVGVSVLDTSFDVDLILCINAVLGILSQLGISEADNKPIIDSTTTWSELLGTRTDLEMVKTYIAFKTKMMFDPPTNSASIEAFNKLIAEYEWRLVNLTCNKGVSTSV